MRYFIRLFQLEHALNRLLEVVRVAVDGSSELVIVDSEAQRHFIIRPRCDQYWHQGQIVARIVEVLQIQGIVPHLVMGGFSEARLTYFEFENEDNGIDLKCNIDPLTQPRHREFEMYFPPTYKFLQYPLEQLDFILPRFPLCRLQCEKVVCGQYAENRRGIPRTGFTTP